MSDWFEILVCPSCRHGLTHKDNLLRCVTCSRDYPLRQGRPNFLAMAEQDALLDGVDAASMVAGYRAPSKLMTSLRGLISSEYQPGNAWRDAKARALATEGKALVIGSGITRYDNAIHLDIDDFPGVDVVGDAHHLPLADGSVGSVVCETVLEHVPAPNQVIAETLRVLKPGGRFFYIVPFLFPFHGHPSDYQRWSKQGLRAAFEAFDEVEVGIHAGPCSAMVNLLTEWAYLFSGFAFPKMYVPIKGGLTALLFPIKYLDLWCNRLPEAHRMAATLYISGRRRP